MPLKYARIIRLYLHTVLTRAKLWLYLRLTVPGQTYVESKIRYFRFGIPLILKRTDRTVSTEADALRYLNRVVPHLPIPKLIESFELDGVSYAVITKLPGKTMIEMPDLDPDVFTSVKEEILSIIDQLWSLPQPPSLAGQVMVSASGHGLPHPVHFYEHINGPFSNTLALYKTMVLDLDIHSPETLKPILDDPIVFQPADLAMQNILIQNGRLSGLIDWEDAGWLPRHWLLHRLRRPRPGCEGYWARYWIFTHKFDPAIEAAYDASLKKDMIVFPI